LLPLLLQLLELLHPLEHQPESLLWLFFRLGFLIIG